MSETLTVNDRVALRIIETTPAVVKFNYEEMEANLDSVLIRYAGLTFTDNDAAECKKTIAELRKGQKALADFRLKTKKELTESVGAFEAQCKKLHDKFETVIGPLTTQNDKFETDRKEKKRTEVQSIIDKLVAEYGLAEKYTQPLRIFDTYLAKGTTLKSITAELGVFAKTAKLRQDKDEQDIEMIKAKVALANVQYQLKNQLLLQQYLRLLDHTPVYEIDALITSDALEIKATEDRIAEQDKKVTEIVREYITADRVTAPEPEPERAPFIPNRAQVPLMPRIIAVYEVTGTETQLEELEKYMDTLQLSWVDRPSV